jgi:hypothetical protein
MNTKNKQFIIKLKKNIKFIKNEISITKFKKIVITKEIYINIQYVKNYI